MPPRDVEAESKAFGEIVTRLFKEARELRWTLKNYNYHLEHCRALCEEIAGCELKEWTEADLREYARLYIEEEYRMGITIQDKLKKAEEWLQTRVMLQTCTAEAQQAQRRVDAVNVALGTVSEELIEMLRPGKDCILPVSGGFVIGSWRGGTHWLNFIEEDKDEKEGTNGQESTEEAGEADRSPTERRDTEGGKDPGGTEEGGIKRTPEEETEGGKVDATPEE